VKFTYEEVTLCEEMLVTKGRGLQIDVERVWGGVEVEGDEGIVIGEGGGGDTVIS
jgi:hypothetical protein